jgi:carbamoyltransferase
VYILGIWDGHDSGAAIIKDNNILVALNEERLTRRKLEILFPEHSIKACLNYLKLVPADITQIAVSTYDFSKTMARILPYTKEEYYLIRRRKKMSGGVSNLKKRAKYKLTEFGPGYLTRRLSEMCVRKELNRAGFTNYQVHMVDHHLCHATAAAFPSGFNECLVITIDGIGDALSGTLSTFAKGKLSRKAVISGKDSLGIFFEHVTNLMNMRELEDEGKVMALANYAYPIPDSENPLLEFIQVNGLSVKCKYSTLRMYDELKKILWKYPSEQFAYMAQRTLEVKIVELVRNGLSATGLKHVALAGGVFSNIKVNMLIRTLPEVEGCFVFPHMGDGGLALGAALSLNYDLNGISSYPLNDVFLGTGYSEEQMKTELEASGLEYSYYENIEEETARLISEGYIIFWFQGRMEFGPRSLGHRSILALPNSKRIKDLLNLRLKMRVWYQPFCPSMLEEDAQLLLEEYDSPNRFMTMGYMVKDDKRDDVEGVISVDGSCRPQVLNGNESEYGRLLTSVKRFTGSGVLLNTSFNIHGEPLVCSPKDAIDTLKRTGNDYLVMGNYLVRGVLSKVQ